MLRTSATTGATHQWYPLGRRGRISPRRGVTIGSNFTISGIDSNRTMVSNFTNGSNHTNINIDSNIVTKSSDPSNVTNISGSNIYSTHVNNKWFTTNIPYT